MAKNLKINAPEQQQQTKTLSEEKLLDELGVMVVQDAESLTQLLRRLRKSENQIIS